MARSDGKSTVPFSPTLFCVLWDRAFAIRAFHPAMLLIAGGEDLLVPAFLNRINPKMYKRSTAITDYKEFPFRSHSLVLKEGGRKS